MEVTSILDCPWEFRVEHKGIKIYSTKVHGSDIQGFKGEIDLKVSFRRLISLFNDMPNYKRWVHQLASIEVLEKNEDIEYVVRQVIDVPWPLQQQEVITRTRLVSVGENAIGLVMHEEPDYLPSDSRYYRVRHARGLWVFTPGENGMVHITFVMHIDPGKDVPASLSNTGLFEVPFYTLNNLRNLLQDASYNPPYPTELDQHLAIIEDAQDTP